MITRPGKPRGALVWTSYVEKHNRIMRQHFKWFAQLMAAHFKNIDNHVHMTALTLAGIISAASTAVFASRSLSPRIFENGFGTLAI
jgi:hypothetical protein